MYRHQDAGREAQHGPGEALEGWEQGWWEERGWGRRVGEGGNGGWEVHGFHIEVAHTRNCADEGKRAQDSCL